jgi:hypothetical protein
MISILALGGLLLGFPIIVIAGLAFGGLYSLPGLLMFFGVEKLVTGTNLVSFFYWLWKLFV